MTPSYNPTQDSELCIGHIYSCKIPPYDYLYHNVQRDAYNDDSSQREIKSVDEYAEYTLLRGLFKTEF